MRSVVIIGGGAAGCFCAAELSSLHPDWSITVLEAGPRLMAKLAVTGGGRCNITNTFEGVQSLAEVYPRGDKLMRKALGRFGWEDCLRWFEARGVKFTVQPDHCVFPSSQDAMQIVRTLERAMRDGGVKVLCNSKVEAVGADLSVISTGAKRSGEISPLIRPSAIVLTTGGGTASLLAGTGIELIPDVPSLFTLKVADAGLRSLMGTVVDNVTLGLAGTRFRSRGTLLLTDWGVSGPATLRLSSYAARYLAENGYRGTLLVNWIGVGEAGARALLDGQSKSNKDKMIANCHPSMLSDRLWRLLVSRSGIRPDCRWAELGSKGMARLINVLISDTYEIIGRARFKEEFVTCGGVSLNEIRPDTLESRRIPGLYFAGEVLDVDAVTGGFNLQAAWSTAWTVAHAISQNLQ
ncbi:MAG: aminoacetone oxidase family FAD-binding enzyme [Bacteroidales bacterium]|nr:aminoacetone oxidase family FAD-binding enzyme [Bacteroidales bacterium]